MFRSDLFRKKTIDSILAHADEPGKTGHSLKRNLSVRDLTALGIAAIIGAGIFSTIGTAAEAGGPAVSLLFIFTAVACGFSALCYAEFSSAIPISGSAYTYAYASFGELIAWIIGWDLIMEYAVGNVAVAISWSEYFTSLLSGIGLKVPEFLTVDFLSASRGYKEAIIQIAHGTSVENLAYNIREAYLAWTSAPQIFGFHIIFDLPAFGIVMFISSLVYVGIHESKVAGNIMVLLKLIILMAFIGVGVFYVNPGNWSPFAPNGLPGVLKGVAGVFFAYIGFDAISTTAEECNNPQKDLPKAMMLSLAITSVLYIVISLVLTGMVSYKELSVGDPLSYVFERVHLLKFSGLIAFSAVIAMASVLLVFQIGQPRIWMSMSRDGLLPKIFSSIHPKYKTPWFATIITGIFVAVPALFLNLTEVTDLTSIGTLFAFVLVSGGVLIIKKDQDTSTRKKGFRVPFYDSRKWLPIIWICILLILWIWYPEGLGSLFVKGNWHHNWPSMIFIIVSIGLTTLSIVKQLSLIPVLGLLTNLYLMSELGVTNWLRFLIWLIVGLLLYFTYGYKHSRLRTLSKVKSNN